MGKNNKSVVDTQNLTPQETRQLLEIFDRTAIKEPIDLPKTDGTRFKGVIDGLVRTPYNYEEYKGIVWEVMIYLTSGETCAINVEHEAVKDVVDFNGDIVFKYMAP